MRSHDDRDGERSDGGGLSERLGRILRADGDDDLLVEGGNADEGVVRWLRALDLQVIGACRADERLKPLLKLNLSAGAAEDHLMAQLNQHFDAAEVGMLIRCLCVPLVSMRVGKVNRIGSMLFPTNIRGDLNIMLSPLSDIRILFCGDDGCHERLGLVDHNLEVSEVSAEEISADTTGRSFLLKLSGDKVLYFWSSEKSKDVGSELLDKMKNLFKQRPSLSQLTGISESRLDSFASSLMTNFISSSNSTSLKTGSLSDSSTPASSNHLLGVNSQSFLKSHARLGPNQVGKSQPLYQGSLSPRSNAFKDGLSRTQMLRNGVREKLKRRADNSSSSSSLVNDTTNIACSTISEGSCSFYSSAKGSSSCQSLEDRTDLTKDKANFTKLDRLAFSLPTPPLPLPSPLSSLAPVSSHHPLPDLPISCPTLFSPYYCLCPPSPSPQYVAAPPSRPSMTPDPLALPPLSSVLPTASSNLFLSTPPCDSNELPALDLPTLLPASSFVSMSNPSQVLSFTPFIAEPIVHIPVMEVCSSGPGYLVSAGPAISSTIPLLPKLASTLAPETASAAEKNARETLRMLMASTPSNPQLIKVLPAVLTSVDENISFIHEKKQGLVVGGSKGLYAGLQDADAVASCISFSGLKPSSITDNPGDNDCKDANESLKAGNHQLEENTEESGRSKSNSID